MMPTFLGRLHPLMLHIPIGVYVLLFLLQYVFRRTQGREDIVRAVLLTGAVSSAAAAGLGWMLSLEGDHAGDTLEWHRWLGVGFAVAGCILYAAYILAGSGRIPMKAYHGLFMLTVLLMTLAGHFGAELTHGKGYLLGDTGVGEESATVSAQASPNDTSLFHTAVMPVLQARCVQCHKPGKTKGGLRMDAHALLMKGGRNGAVVVPGDPTGSEMVRRILLPADDEKHMPPRGKQQLTKEETALLHWWIVHGASADAGLSGDMRANDTLRPFLGKDVAPAAGPKEAALPQVRLPDSVILSALRQRGWTVRPVSMGSPLLDISAMNIEGWKDADLAALLPVAENIFWLDLSGMPLTDRATSALSGCTNLRRLSLKGTGIGSPGLAGLAGLPSLEYLNLVGTGIDDASLQTLAGMRSLKKAYAWNTRITPAAAAAFMQKHPGMILETGTK
jgi:uncharacterized membrane protein